MKGFLTALYVAFLAALWVSGLMAGMWRMRSTPYGIGQPVPKDDPWRLWRFAVRDPWMWATLFLAPLFYVFIFVSGAFSKGGV